MMAEHLDGLVSTLPDLRDVVVLRWSDAPTVWSAGRLFVLPHESQALPVEASLAPFRTALSLRTAEDEARDRVHRVPVLETVRRELLARPTRPASQSCVTQLVARALEAPDSELWLIPTDLQDFQCPVTHGCVPGGARVYVLAIPQREGADTRARLEARMARLRSVFPEVVVVPTWGIASPSDLRSLVERAVERRTGGDPQ
jgi:hypothetical protein